MHFQYPALCFPLLMIVGFDIIFVCGWFSTFILCLPLSVSFPMCFSCSLLFLFFPSCCCCCCCWVASVVSDSVWPHRRQPTRLCRPWDSPGQNTGVESGFLYFLQFKSEFGNKEFMIWAIVSSWSCFCWLYRASPSLAAKHVINLISVLAIWWCPCVESSPVLLEEGVCYDQCVLLAKLY